MVGIGEFLRIQWELDKQGLVPRVGEFELSQTTNLVTVNADFFTNEEEEYDFLMQHTSILATGTSGTSTPLHLELWLNVPGLSAWTRVWGLSRPMSDTAFIGNPAPIILTPGVQARATCFFNAAGANNNVWVNGLGIYIPKTIF